MPNNSNKYIQLESGFESSLYGSQAPTFDASQKVSTFLTFNFMYVAAITTIIAAAAIMYMVAGGWRIEASERGIRKSDETFKRVTIGLIGVLSLFTILYTLNRDLLRGDVGLEQLKSSVAGGTTGVVPYTAQASGSAAPATCAAPQLVAAQIASGNLCGQASCTALTGCNYQQYLPAIESAASQQGVNKNLVIAIMCQESKGNRNSSNKNPNGTYDCGLMQINQNTPCDASSLDPVNNISAGVSLLKRVIGSTTVYGNIPAYASVAASYNSGSKYNNPSADCNASSGFPVTPPKWACPINPGDGQFNMCAVENYACGISACVQQLGGGS